MTDWLISDPLALCLIGRGYKRCDAYNACEQIATRTADGEPELEAIAAVLGSVPLSERERLTRESTPTANGKE